MYYVDQLYDYSKIGAYDFSKIGGFGKVRGVIQSMGVSTLLHTISLQGTLGHFLHWEFNYGVGMGRIRGHVGPKTK